MVKEFFLNKNNAPIAVSVFSTQAPNCIVFLNGLFHGKSDYDYFYTEAAKRISELNIASVVLFDYIGHGDSYGQIGDITLKVMVDNLHDIISVVIRRYLKYGKCLIFGMGIAGLVVDQLFKGYPESVNWVKKVLLFSPTISIPECEQWCELIAKDEVIMLTEIMPHLNYENYFNYDIKLIRVFSNFGTAVENILGTPICTGALMDFVLAAKLVNYIEFLVPLECILCEKDFRKKYINPLMSCKLVEVQGEGVLPTSPTIKDIIVKRIQDYALAVEM